MAKRYKWPDSPAYEFWMWARRAGLEEPLERVWKDAGASLNQPDFPEANTVGDIFCREWEEIFLSGPTREKALQWIEAKRERLDYYRTLGALANDLESYD